MDLYARKRSLLTLDEIEAIFNRIEAFDFNGSKIRAVADRGETWIVFADICKALGYQNPNHESKRIATEEKCKLDIGIKNTLVVCVNFRGLRSFALLSGKGQAMELYRWAAKEIFGR